MAYDLALTPHGHLRCCASGEPDDAVSGGAALDDLAAAFGRNDGEGLFRLAATKIDGFSASFTFWRAFAARYMTALCHAPEIDGVREPVEPLGAADATELVLGAPPMAGAEYLNGDVLAVLWRAVDTWAAAAIAKQGGTTADFLAAEAPLWHRIGRVCFHLAENKKDPACPFAFIATYAARLSAHDRVVYQPLSLALQEYVGARSRTTLIKLLSPVNLAAARSPLVKELVEQGDIYHPLAWTAEEAHRFLKEADACEASGILLRLPDWWRKRPRPRVSVTVGKLPGRGLGAKALLDFDVTLSLDGQTMSREEWKRMMAAGDGLFFLKGQWVEVDRAKLSEALEHWERVKDNATEHGLTFIEGMRLLAGAPADLAPGGVGGDQAWAFAQPGDWLRGLLDGLRQPGTLDAIAPGQALRTELRPYQDVGVKWLWFVSQLGLGACLADDMGLGKTVQVIALLLALKKHKAGLPSLLILPASLLANWKRELERFAPSLKHLFLHPSQMAADTLAAIAAKPARHFEGIDLVVTTYTLAARLDWLAARDWELVILDEAQAIKNPAARQTVTVKRFNAKSRIALTGTPVENRVADLWSIFDFILPGLLGTAGRFKQFITGLKQRTDQQFAPLRALVQPYILRRLKTDRSIIADLPDKTEVNAFCGLAKEQAVLYARAVNELAEALANVDGMKRRGIVLSYLMRFKQICNHPSQCLGDDRYDPAHSGKFARLRELCEEIASRQERALVFTQFREVTEPLAAFLATVFGRSGLVLHGGTPVKARAKLVESFQAEDGPPFFVLSLKAGGTGLNLTAASHVIHFDRWWNPAVENQATDRAFRIGQRRNVLVHKFVCQGTVEEKIDAMIQDKTALARDILEGGAETLLTEMSNDDLLRMVSLDISKACE